MLLLAATTAFGQKRVYIQKDVFGDDIYLVQQKDGKLTAFFQLNMVSPSDSIFLVVDEGNVQQVHDYMIALRDKYRDWSRTAKGNHIKDFRKDVDIESPIVRFRWVERVDSEFYFQAFRRVEYFSTDGRWLKPYFRANDIGGCNLYAEVQLTCDDSQYQGTYKCWFPLHQNDLNLIIRWTDWGKLERYYERKKPKLTDKEIYDLFQ